MRTTPSPLPPITERPSAENWTTFTAPLLLPASIRRLLPDANSMSRTSPFAVGAASRRPSGLTSGKAVSVVAPGTATNRSIPGGTSASTASTAPSVASDGSRRRALEREEQRQARLVRRQPTGLLDEAGGIGHACLLAGVAALLAGVAALLDGDAGGDQGDHEQQGHAPDQEAEALVDPELVPSPVLGRSLLRLDQRATGVEKRPLGDADAGRARSRQSRALVRRTPRYSSLSGRPMASQVSAATVR